MLPGPATYTDFQGLAKLRAAARADSPEALQTVAEQFEALFLQMMLKSMRAATPEDDLFNNEQSDMYRDVLDQQLSINLSHGRTVGLADMLVKQLGGDTEKAAPVQVASMDHSFAERLFRGEIKPLPPQGITPNHHFHTGIPRASVTPNATLDSAGVLNSPEAFIQSLWPHAKQAAASLGVQPEVLLAQAALETHWGESVINFRDGRSSHNLFGIKADPSWDGGRISVPTLEYINGIAVKRNDAFRAYDSYAASFQDYVDLLRSNPRYDEAVQRSHDPVAFTRALQDAGYATDPNYAAKINAILNSETMGAALINVKDRQ